MRILQTLSGSGLMKDGGADIAMATYRFDIVENNGLKSGHGWVEADVGSLHKAFHARNLTIRRQDAGKDIRTPVTELRTSSNRATAMLNGSPD